MAAVLWLLLLVPLLLGLAAQGLVRSVFRRYGTVMNHSGVTGAEAARALLDAHGLQRIRIESIPGFLTDHYDGQAKALRLSEPVAGERSVAALGIAGHEVSHAYQDAEGSRTYRARQSIGEQLAQFAPWSSFFLIAGFWLDVPLFIVLSLIFVGGLVLFALATLPVEIGASQRALMLLRETGLADPGEFREIRRPPGRGADVRGWPSRQTRLLPRPAVRGRGRAPRRSVGSRTPAPLDPGSSFGEEERGGTRWPTLSPGEAEPEAADPRRRSAR